MWVVIADGAIMREKGKVTPRDRRLIKHGRRPTARR
jgi:hypothetical protein